MDTHSHSDKKNNVPVTEQTSQEDFLPDELSIFSDFRGIQRAIKEPNPHFLTPDVVLQLQHTIGNQAVQRLLAERMVQRRVADPDELPAMPGDSRHHQLDFVTIKLNGRGVDHWWIEIDGTESYGWWPNRAPASTGDAAWSHGIVGVPGVLNAVGRTDLRGTPTLDPHHGHTAPETFHPYTVDASDNLSDDEVRQRIRRFAQGFSGEYSIVTGPNCHTFIRDLMRTVGLSMGRTAGSDPIVP